MASTLTQYEQYVHELKYTSGKVRYAVGKKNEKGFYEWPLTEQEFDEIVKENPLWLEYPTKEVVTKVSDCWKFDTKRAALMEAKKRFK